MKQRRGPGEMDADQPDIQAINTLYTPEMLHQNKEMLQHSLFVELC